MNNFLKDAKELQQEIQVSIGAKAAAANSGSINENSLKSGGSSKVDLEKQEYKRDEDGEFAHTKGLDNRMLIQQQKNMIERQDEQLDDIAGVVDQIRFEN